MADKRRESTRRNEPQPSTLAVRGDILRAALGDLRYRDALIKADTKKARRELTGTDLDVRVYMEEPREFILLIPQRSPDLYTHLEAMDADFRLFHGVGPTRGQLECMILKRAYDDPSFYERLVSSPRDILDNVLRRHGGPLPPDVKVTLILEEPGEVVVVLPSPRISDELSDEELEAVALAAFPVAWIVAATVSEIGKVTVGSTVSATVGSVVTVKVTDPATTITADPIEGGDQV